MLNKHRLTAVLLLYAIGTILLFPYHQYNFSYDEIGYMAVTKRLASGDYYTAVNGYWSPLLSWLTLPFYKAGMDLLFALRLVSILCGAGIFISVNRLLERVKITGHLRTVTLFLCIPIVLSYVLCEQAADVLLCLLLLIYIGIVTAEDFFENRRKNILCGIIAGISYFAKAYAFPFFLAYFTVVQVVLYYHSASAFRKKWLVRNLVTGIGVFLLLAAPWIFALYHKYGMITFGYSGKLNYYWYVYGFGPDAGKLQTVDPSPHSCLWEDPWYFPWNAKPHPPLSLALIKKQLSVAGLNLGKTISIVNAMSFLGMAIVMSLAVYAIKKRHVALTLLLLAVVILPAGYLPVAIESRYLYAVTFILLITGVLLLTEVWRLAAVHKAVQITGWCIFAMSFLYNPLLHLNNPNREGATAFQLAGSFKKNGVKGKIACTASPNIPMLAKAIFLSENRFYEITGGPQGFGQLAGLCRQSNIDYFVYFYYHPAEAATFKNTEWYKNAVKEIDTKTNNMILIQLK